MKLLLAKDWTERAQTHLELVGPFADAFVQRRDRGQTHPIHDFLFTYYPFSPGKLKQWIPSFEEALQIETAEQARPFSELWFVREGNVLRLDGKKLQGSVLSLVSFIEALCRALLEKAPRFGCFGLHEWAMVYRMASEQLRHNSYRLRLPPDDLAHFVESQNLCCTHYDAYRFFTPAAVPRNALKPTLQSRLQQEQAGCVHANMDIYKWATKLWPWIGSDFIAKAFILALEGRELDMRASPYDLQALGYAPIRIETDEGRKEYQLLQQALTQKAQGLRQELAAFCSRLRNFNREEEEAGLLLL